MTDQGFNSPGRAVFMTQNTDRPFCEALMDAMSEARKRRGLPPDAKLTWNNVADVLADEEVYLRLRERHSDTLARRVADAAHGACEGVCGALVQMIMAALLSPSER